MTKTEKSSNKPETQLLAFGLDGSGKPIGARFPAGDQEVALPVIEALKLQHCLACSEELGSIGAKLPIGRVYARGKSFIPAIKRDLYDKLASTLAAQTAAAGRPEAKPTAEASSEKPTNGPAASSEPAAKLPPLASGLPQNWESIAAGNMVLSHEGPGEGWWEAIVIAREDEIVTLRYRDYPKVPKFERHVSTLALINPRPA